MGIIKFGGDTLFQLEIPINYIALKMIDMVRFFRIE